MTRLRHPPSRRFGVASELMNSENLTEFAKRYAKAWCSQNPESVAAFFAENALLTVNGGPPTSPLEVARAFMRDFPDMTVMFDKLEPRRDRTVFHWTLTGTYAGTGNHVQISGCEIWRINDACLIAESNGHFDAAEYERQLRDGFDPGSSD